MSLAGIIITPRRRYDKVTDIPYRLLRRYTCWLCEARLSAVAQAGCLSMFGRSAEERAGCNATGNGQLKGYWAAQKPPKGKEYR